MIKDAQGHSVSGATNEAVVLYDQAVRAYNSGHGDALGLFDETLAAAPDFAMAHIGKAWLFNLANDPTLMTKARAGRDAAAAGLMNDREHAHVAALTEAGSGARGAAVTILDRHLMQYPFDLVAHQAAMLLDGYLGRFRWVRDRSARALPQWSRAMPSFGTMLAFQGFGHEEAGDYARAEDVSREAAALEPHSFWPHHTVSHVMEMTGRPREGLNWMDSRAPYWSAPENLTRVHIWWHKSLYHVELGQYDAALALYDGPILETLRPLGLNLCNTSALLWRLDTLGVDVTARWRDLVGRWDGHADGQCLLFTDLHAIMAELGAGDDALVQRRLAWMRATASGTTETATIYREVGLPLMDGLIAFHRGEYARAVALLQPVRFDLWRIGGSHAQRDVVDWTLTEAALRGGMRPVALSLAHERLGTRPDSVVNRGFLERAERIAA